LTICEDADRSPVLSRVGHCASTVNRSLDPISAGCSRASWSSSRSWLLRCS